MNFRHVRSRIACYMVATMLATLFLCWFILFLYFRDILVDQVLNDNYTASRQLASGIDNEYEYVTHYANNIVYDETLLQALSCYYENTGFWKFSWQSIISRIITDYMLLGKKVIYDIYIVHYDGTYSISDHGSHTEILKESWFQKFLFGSSSTSGLTGLHQTVDTSRTHQRVNTFSYIRPIVSLDRPFQLLGYLVIDFSVEELFSSLLSTRETGYFISDDSGIFYTGSAEIISPPQDSLRNSEIFRYQGNYYFPTYMESFEKYFVAVINEEVIHSALNGSVSWMLLLLCLGILLTLSAVVVLSKSITRPILTLTEGMKKAVSSGFKPRLAISGRDEMAELTVIFNTMQEDIRSLIQQNEQIHQQDKNLQLKYYMSKINPHFLYNSLNCVIYLARKQHYEEIISFTRALISILRQNIAIGDSLISLQEEKNYLLAYMQIISYRYDNVRLHLHIDPQLKTLLIQPMILYPLVENAIFHGLSPAEKGGQVEVSIWESPQKTVFFTVKDNGVGMSKERQQEVQNYLDDAENRSIYGSIGLKNVNDRLRLFYPSCKGLKIHSDSGKGTEITFSICKKELDISPQSSPRGE